MLTYMKQNNTPQKKQLSGKSVWTALQAFSVLAVLGVFGYGYVVTQGQSIADTLRPEVEQKVEAIEKQKVVTVALPPLNLNRQNVRQAPEITVDPENFGKENPFSAPAQ
jgi:flagellar basal body-associated protein FliL